VNIREYIESGILELYVAGALTEREMRDVEEMVNLYPEIAQELVEIENSMMQFSAAMSKGPQPELKQRILDQITDEPAVTATPVISIRKNNSLWTYLSAAMIALLLISNIGVYSLWQSTNSELTALREENRQSNLQLASLKTSYDETNRSLEVLRNPDFIKLKLNGLPLSPSSSAVVYWNTNSKKVMIDVINLPETDEQHDYQLWALVDGKPVDAGVFSPGKSNINFFELKNMEKAQAFAVTLEPKGGSINPTLDKMYLMGQI
jgi:anti-sigma-K factor RskA